MQDVEFLKIRDILQLNGMLIIMEGHNPPAGHMQKIFVDLLILIQGKDHIHGEKLG